MSLLDSRPSTSRASREEETDEETGATQMYSKEWYQRRRLLTCNQVTMLRDRELGRRTRDTNQYRHDRDLYTTLRLERYVQSQEMLGPRDHILGWTPDGLRLITLAYHLEILRIYRYNGVQAAMGVREDHVLNELFTLQSEIKVRQQEVNFRLECVLFTDDARHLIIPATCTVNESQLSLHSLFRTNEGVALQNIHIEDFYFYCIDIAKGAVVGQHAYRRDRITLPHGVQISKRFLCVTSHQHQVMHLLRVHPQTGALIPLKDIGPSVQDDDDLHLPVTQASHLRTNFVSGFKQRILTFLYNRSKKERKIAEFLRSSEYFTSLKLDKVHIFEEFFLLIRMLPRDFGRETSSLPCFFVIMDWRDASILEIYNSFDERFYNCVVALSPSLLFPITTDAWVGADLFPVHARMAIARGRKRGDPRHSSETLRRLLNQLPFPSYQPYKISAQTPYLDPYLFILDDKIAAGITNGKLRLDNEDPRFMSSRSGRVAFQLPLSAVCGGGQLRQVSLLFHPRDPLCLGNDRLRTDPCVLVFLPKTGEEEEKKEEDQETAGGSDE